MCREVGEQEAGRRPINRSQSRAEGRKRQGRKTHGTKPEVIQQSFSLGRAVQRPRMLHLLHWRVGQLQTTRCTLPARCEDQPLYQPSRRLEGAERARVRLECPALNSTIDTVHWTVRLLSQCERRRASS